MVIMFVKEHWDKNVEWKSQVFKHVHDERNFLSMIMIAFICFGDFRNKCLLQKKKMARFSPSTFTPQRNKPQPV